MRLLVPNRDFVPKRYTHKNRGHLMVKANFLKSAQLSAVAVAMMLGAVGTAQAVTYNYDFGTLVTAPGHAGSSTFASLSVETSDNTSFTFTLKANDLASVFGDADAYVSVLRGNTLSTADPGSPTMLSSSTIVNTVTLSTTDMSLGGTIWEFGNGLGAGTPSAATTLQSNEEVRWTTTFLTAQTAPFFGDPAFALTVRYSGLNDTYSSNVAAIPEPEIYAMMGVGLGLLGWVGRRRKQQAA